MVTPWILGAIRHTFWLLVTGAAGFWVGVPQVTRTIAEDWSRRAHDAGVPTNIDSSLYYAIYIVAFITFLVGWILSSYLTVWIINRLIF